MIEERLDEWDIKKALKVKHFRDVVVCNCHTGATHRFMDVLVFKRTYAPPNAICYEIKTSRSDFLREMRDHNKYETYMRCCHRFYYVSPPDVIQREDLPEGAGLFHVTGEKGTFGYLDFRLVKRCKVRTHRLPENLYLSLIINEPDIWNKMEAPND